MMTSFHEFERILTRGDIDALKPLLRKDHINRALDGRGWKMIHSAAYHGQLRFIEILIRHQADVNALTKDFRTPLDIALDQSQWEAGAAIYTRGGNALRSDMDKVAAFSRWLRHRNIAPQPIFMSTKRREGPAPAI